MKRSGIARRRKKCWPSTRFSRSYSLHRSRFPYERCFTHVLKVIHEVHRPFIATPYWVPFNINVFLSIKVHLCAESWVRDAENVEKGKETRLESCKNCSGMLTQQYVAGHEVIKKTIAPCKLPCFAERRRTRSSCAAGSICQDESTATSTGTVRFGRGRRAPCWGRLPVSGLADRPVPTRWPSTGWDQPASTVATVGTRGRCVGQRPLAAAASEGPRRWKGNLP